MTRNNKRRGILAWLRSRRGQQATIIILFLLAPLVLLFLFTYYPFGSMIKFSFYQMKYVGEREWVGFDNYINVFHREDCFIALRNSLYYMGGAVIQLILALFLATILSFKIKGGNIFKGLIFFPFLVNGIALGFIFKFLYARGLVLDSLLQSLGFNLDNLPYWLKDQSINNISLVISSIWRYLGQNMVLFIGAIMSVDNEMYEAARLDGASKFKQFLYIILPSIKTIVILNIILSISGSIAVFEPPYVITGGGVGTGTYFVVMDQVAHVSQKVGLASAMAVVLLFIIIIATVIQNVLLKYVFKNTDTTDTAYIARRRERSLARYRRWH